MILFAKEKGAFFEETLRTEEMRVFCQCFCGNSTFNNL